MSKTISIQTANTETGDFDVMKPRPYPFHIDAETGEVGRQDFWKGDPFKLVGFQNDANRQTVDVFYTAFVADPQAVVGKFPVFLRADGSMYSMTVPVDTITVSE